MKVLISGASGLIGKALFSELSNAGHQPLRLVRANSAKAPGDVLWDPKNGKIDASLLESAEAVIHLAGESIMGRWTASKKEKILQSRVQGTHLLAKALSNLKNPPKVFMTASAIGFYGDRGDEPLKEDSSNGTLFLSEVCREWEKATQPAKDKAIRTIHLRFGVILSPKGGALAKMLFPFKMGAGGVLGSGKQWMSWISLPDAARAILHILKTESLSGPVNIVAPNPATNFEFTKSLGKALRRPTVIPMPAFAARLVFGQMADELLLASARVLPAKLLSSGFAFQHPSLETAFQDLL